MTKRAVVLLNLGGPDSLDAVEPFLLNFFRDPAIIGLPGPLRRVVAWLIAKKRGPEAREIYAKLGGKSPLLENTEAQARALEEAISGDNGETRVFIAMRYWHPMSDRTAAEVKAFDPDRVILLPLYPQYSTTTTGSSVTEWRRAAKMAGLSKPTRVVCCYWAERRFLEAHADLIAAAVGRAKAVGTPRVLFSAHGLPKKIIAGGDPYQWQVEHTCEGIIDAMAETPDWMICYQSRVGPLEWIGPSIDKALEHAARDGVPVVVVPIAFVSEHSETLVELDIQYRERAAELGIPAYERVPALGAAAGFIGALAEIARCAPEDAGTGPASATKTCPGMHGQCLVRADG